LALLIMADPRLTEYMTDDPAKGMTMLVLKEYDGMAEKSAWHGRAPGTSKPSFSFRASVPFPTTDSYEETAAKILALGQSGAEMLRDYGFLPSQMAISVSLVDDLLTLQMKPTEPTPTTARL
jgi:hypothetical protein